MLATPAFQASSNRALGAFFNPHLKWGLVISLKERYPDVNITVADFKNGKQEDAYMLGSRGITT